MGRRMSDKELDEILERLRRGDMAAMVLVTRENVVRLLAHADGDDRLEKMLREKL
jgi:hypothetical protein